MYQNIAHPAPFTVAPRQYRRCRLTKKKQREIECPYASGGKASRLWVQIAYLCASLGVTRAARSLVDPRPSFANKVRRSHERESAIHVITTFVDEDRHGMVFWPSAEEVVERGKRTFGASALSVVYQLMQDVGMMRVYRPCHPGQPTSYRDREFDLRKVQAIIAAASPSDVRRACTLIHEQPRIAAAYASANDIWREIMEIRKTWTSAVAMAALVSRVYEECGAIVQNRPVAFARPLPAGECKSRRLEVTGSPILGWDDVKCDCDLPPLDNTQPPSLSDESDEEFEKPSRASGAAVEDLELSAEQPLTSSDNDAHDETVTETHGNDGTEAMPNLTGQGVLTKEEQVAAGQLRKQSAKAARSKETTSRALGDLAAPTGPSPSQVEAMRATLAQQDLNETLFNEFIDKMNGYGWRGKTQKQVDSTVALWFSERVQNGGFRVAAAKDQGSAPAMDTAYLWTELCGNAEGGVWADKIVKAGLSRYEELAMGSALRIASIYNDTANQIAAWEGVKEIGRELKSCAFLFHIATLRITEDGYSVSVLHPFADRTAGLLATQDHADAVAMVVEAITGKKTVGVPHGAAWVGMTARQLVRLHLF